MITRKIVCDSCNKVIDGDEDEIEWQEWLSLNIEGGYGAPFGDGVVVTLDLCPECQISILGSYVRYPIVPNDPTHYVTNDEKNIIVDSICYAGIHSSEVFYNCHTHNIPYPRGATCPKCGDKTNE